MNRKEFDLLYTIKKFGITNQRALSRLASVSTGYVSQTLKKFNNDGIVDSEGITDAGLRLLEPYRVNNAIIMAAGMSTRFVPLSIEKPKGLLKVRDEVLIERQIKQLKSAGISDIVIVLGYMKESFFYLENKYSGIKFIINSQYNIKNNSYTLLLAKDYLSNTYICSSDNYFTENPFEEYVYQSYYAGVHVSEKTNEWYMYPDSKGNIKRVVIGGNDGNIMLGHAYWDHAFSKSMINLLNEGSETGRYDNSLWEQILMDNVNNLPPMGIRLYPNGIIFEFDSLDELRKFDDTYVKKTDSMIMHNICSVLNCREQDILNFVTIKEGITNTSFVFEVYGKKYVYRHPGPDSEVLISRKREKEVLEKVKKYDIDPTYIYMSEEGWKISHYIEDFRIPDYNSFEDSKRVCNVIKKLHNIDVKVDWEFDPWEKASYLEGLLNTNSTPIADVEFIDIKEDIRRCNEIAKECNLDKVLCHCDTYAHNWIISNSNTILIDWEYAGNADPGCDVGSYIMDSMWDIPEAETFIRLYCGENYSEQLRIHYLAFTAVISFYWYVWALYREHSGIVMGDSLYRWRAMAKKYSKYIKKTTGV